MTSTRASALVLAGAVGLTGLGVGAVIGPAAASAATSSATHAVGDRVTAIKNALAGLVKDGTITQAQADKVATTLDGALPPGGFRGHGGPGMHLGGGLDEVAGMLGVSEDTLRAQLQSGKTLAEIAKSKNISQSTLVSKLVAAAKARIAADVKAGRLTQAQADAIAKDLTARVTRMVTSTPPMRGGHGHRFGQDGAPAPGRSGPDSSGSGSGGSGSSGTSWSTSGSTMAATSA
jgi:hypothetical protein